MERLIFENALGEQIVFDKHGTYRWTQVDGLGGNSVTYQATQSPYQDGVTPSGNAYFETFPVMVDFIIVSENMIAALRDLNRKLNPKLGLCRLIYERDGVRRCYEKVMVRSLPTLPGGNDRGLRWQMTRAVFEVSDPYYVDEGYTEEETVTGINMFEFPFELTDADDFEFDIKVASGVTVFNDGDVACPVEVIFEGPLTAPLELTNLTTGEKIVISLNLGSDERLTIFTKLEEVNVVKTTISTGTTETAFQYIDIGETDFFYLQPGENSLTLAATEGLVYGATIKYKQRYVGI